MIGQSITMIWKLTVYVMLVLWCQETAAGEKQIQQCKVEPTRLPHRIRPTEYQLTLSFDNINFTYDGHVRIHIQTTDDHACKLNLRDNFVKFLKFEKTCDDATIILHASREMKIYDVKYDGQDVRMACRDSSSGLVMLKVRQPLMKGSEGYLELSFSETIGKDGYGLSRSHYLDANNREKFAAYAMFEPNWASKAFPCFDEPEFKAKFNLIIEHDAHLTALSNMPALSHQKVEGTDRMISSFETTPIMSTYLLTFAVGEFEHIETKVLDNKYTIGIYTPPGETRGAQEALDYAAKAYELLADWFGIEQPLNKTDFVVLNDYESAAALESWGLVTTRREIILKSDQKDPTHRYACIVTIGHEFAHYWLGNMVTMKWWDDLWLKEAFAAFMGQFVVQKIAPGREADIYFLTEVKINALKEDIDKMNPSVRFTKEILVSDLKDDEAIFNSMVYNKGASVVGMIYEYLGGDVFQKAIRIYINRHKFKNADHNDLYAALEEASGLNVRNLVQSWLDQPGHPVIKVKLGNGNIHVSQKSVIMHDVNLWIVPMKLLVSDGGSRKQYIKFLLNKQSDSIDLPNWFDSSEKNHFVFVNADFEGFYQTEYDDDLLARLERPIMDGAILSVADRICLIDGMVKFWMTGSIGDEKLIDFLRWFRNETNGGVIKTLVLGFSGEIPYKPVAEVFAKIYDKIGGFKEELSDSFVATRGRYELIKFLLNNDYSPAVTDGLKLFDLLEYPFELAETNIEFFLLISISVIKMGTDQQAHEVCKFIGLNYEKWEHHIKSTGLLDVVYTSGHKLCSDLVFAQFSY